jgi:large subunit ribosomal protein L17
MRHRKSGRKLGRNTSHRKAMLRNMVTSLFQHEKITTTDARAKELRKLAEKLITLAKRGDLHARRQAMEVVRDRQTTAKLFERIAPRYVERPGGYTRIIKLGHRAGDNAAMSIIELVEEEFTPKPKQKAPKAKVETPKPAPAVEKTASAEDAVEEAAEETVEEVTAESAEETTEEAPKEATDDVPTEGEEKND